MLTRERFPFALLLIVLTGGVTAADKKPLTIVVTGDSTVSSYPDSSPLRGWGQVLGEYLTPETKVLDLARSGASTKTFLKLPNWPKALEAKPDFLFIQFGHNDSHGAGKPEATDADTDYAANLRTMVEAARKVGATPVLVTPMHRRKFDADGKVTEELRPYAESMKRVAKELDVPSIDLHALSGDLFNRLGDEASTDLTNMAKPPGDRTHFTPKGARVMAALVARAAAHCDPRLKEVVTAAKVEAALVKP